MTENKNSRGASGLIINRRELMAAASALGLSLQMTPTFAADTPWRTEVHLWITLILAFLKPAM